MHACVHVCMYKVAHNICLALAVVTWPGNENRCTRPFSVTLYGICSCSLSRTFLVRSKVIPRLGIRKSARARAQSSTASSTSSASTTKSRRDFRHPWRNLRKRDSLYGNACSRYVYLPQRRNARRNDKNCAQSASPYISSRFKNFPPPSEADNPR